MELAQEAVTNVELDVQHGVVEGVGKNKRENHGVQIPPTTEMP